MWEGKPGPGHGGGGRGGQIDKEQDLRLHLCGLDVASRHAGGGCSDVCGSRQGKGWLCPPRNTGCCGQEGGSIPASSQQRRVGGAPPAESGQGRCAFTIAAGAREALLLSSELAAGTMQVGGRSGGEFSPQGLQAGSDNGERVPL